MKIDVSKTGKVDAGEDGRVVRRGTDEAELVRHAEQVAYACMQNGPVIVAAGPFLEAGDGCRQSGAFPAGTRVGAVLETKFREGDAGKDELPDCRGRIDTAGL